MRVLQCVPALRVGGVERGTLEVDAALGCASSLVASSGGALAVGLRGVHLRSRALRWRNPLAVLLLNPLLLAYWVRQHQVDIIHARSRCLAISALIVRWLMPRRVRVVVTWHGLYSSGSAWRRTLNGLLLFADLLILPSAAVGRHLRQHYGPITILERSWRVVHRGVDAAAWRCDGCSAEATRGAGAASESRASPSADPPIVLCVGRVSRTKGQDHLLCALHDVGGPLQAVLLGDTGTTPSWALGPWRWLRRQVRMRSYRDRLEVEAARLRADGARVLILPHCDTASVAAHYAAADVVVVPSRRPEAFGRVLVEALAAGRLVVSFYHGAAAELASLLWEHGRDSGGRAGTREPPVLVGMGVLLLGAVLLVTAGDVRGLSRAIRAALDMPERERARRVRAAQAAVRDRLSLVAFIDRTLAVYQELDRPTVR